MANWDISQRLFSAVGALVALLVISGLASFWTGREMKAQLDETSGRTARTLALALRIQRNAVVLSNEQRRLLLAVLGQDEDGMKQARQMTVDTKALNASELEEIRGLLVSNEGRQLVNDISTRLREWDISNEKVAALAAAGNAAEAWDVARQRSSPILQQVERLTNDLVTLQDRTFSATAARSNTAYRTMTLVTAAVLVASLLVALIVSISVRTITRTLRTAIHELDEGARHVVTESTQVASASQALSSGATEQAASLQESSASMEEMASMTRMNAENSQRAAGMMGETERQVRDANAVLGQMVVSMSAIKDSSDKVAKIIKTIDEIAFQTNILALNAAVEAARAGEAGMGFAAVAEEVRTLAQRSAQAAKETAVLIEESIGKANDGHQKVAQVTNAIAAITDSALKVKGLVDEVSVASRQQSQGIDQVSQAITQMEKVTQANAASAEESAAASEELSSQAENAMRVVAGLTTLVGGGRSQSPATAQPRGARDGMPATSSRPAGTLAARPKARFATRRSAEEEIPLEGGAVTGSYGQF